MNYRAVYESWLTSDYFDEQTKEELGKIAGNEKEIEDRFYRDLEFGTGGMRGVIGAGTNRMNTYTIRKAAQGLANYLKKQLKEEGQGVALAYDSRHFSGSFALETALVLAANGIKAYLFDELRPTPELSFAVRYLSCAAGVMITASHNPKEYNGFKAYGFDGCQMPPKASDAVIEEVDAIKDLSSIKVLTKKEAEEKGLLQTIGTQIDDAYIEALKKVCVNPELSRQYGPESPIVFTPLHGTGNKPVRRILKEIGFDRVLVVKEQELPDPDFSTVKYPNPEERASFELAINLARKENVDLIIGTDPDADRIGVVVRDAAGDYITLTGNQTGCLLMEYILSRKKQRNELPANAFVVETIVSSNLAQEIAAHYGVELLEVLTGFKFIGEQIRLLDDSGRKKFLFGFEESYGYLAGTHARDKDAVVAAMLIGEMHAWYKSRGMNLYEGLLEVFSKYGFVREGIDSFTLKGKEGIEKITAAMESLRANRPSVFGSSQVAAVRDYENSVRVNLASGAEEALDLPKSNVLYYEMNSGYWFCVRPSGTEPKIKIYYGVSAPSLKEAEAELDRLKKDVLSVVGPLLN